MILKENSVAAKADKISSNDSSKAKITESQHVSKSKPVADLEHENESVEEAAPEPNTEKAVTLKVEKTVSRRTKSQKNISGRLL